MKLGLKKSLDFFFKFFLAGLFFFHVMGQLVLLCMMAELVLSENVVFIRTALLLSISVFSMLKD